MTYGNVTSGQRFNYGIDVTDVSADGRTIHLIFAFLREDLRQFDRWDTCGVCIGGRRNATQDGIAAQALPSQRLRCAARLRRLRPVAAEEEAVAIVTGGRLQPLLATAPPPFSAGPDVCGFGAGFDTLLRGVNRLCLRILILSQYLWLPGDCSRDRRRFCIGDA